MHLENSIKANGELTIVVRNEKLAKLNKHYKQKT